MSEHIISEVYRDEEGRLRHTNCQRSACRVPNCHDSLVFSIMDYSKEQNYRDDFKFQKVVYREGTVN